MHEIVAIPAMQTPLTMDGADPDGGTPQQSAQVVPGEIEPVGDMVPCTARC